MINRYFKFIGLKPKYFILILIVIALINTSMLFLVDEQIINNSSTIDLILFVALNVLLVGLKWVVIFFIVACIFRGLKKALSVFRSAKE